MRGLEASHGPWNSPQETPFLVGRCLWTRTDARRPGGSAEAFLSRKDFQPRGRASGRPFGEIVAIVPGHPGHGILFHPGGVFEHGAQLVHGRFPGHLAGVDEAHKEVAHVGSPGGFKEGGIFPVQSGVLQRSFIDVIVQGGAGYMAKPGEFLPVFEKVFDGLSQLRVGLHLAVFLFGEAPVFELLHHQGAMALVVGQPLLGTHGPLAREGLMAIDDGELLDHIGAFFGEIFYDLHKVPSGVDQAITDDGLQCRRDVSAEGIAHLQGSFEKGGPFKQEFLEVFSRVVPSGHKKGNLSVLPNGNDSRGEDAFACGFVGIAFVEIVENLHGRVIVLKKLSLGCAIHQGFEKRPQEFGAQLHQFPLGGRGQRDTQVFLKLGQSMERNAATVFEHSRDGDDRFALFDLAYLFRRLGRVNGPASTAAEPLALVDRTAFGSSTFQLKVHSGQGQFIEVSPLALGTAIAGL